MLTSENLTEEATALLRRLLEALIDHPRDLVVEPREHRGMVQWLVVANINDLGIVIGKRGAHAKAIQHLMREIGARHGCHMTVRIEADGPGERQPEAVRRPASPTYSVTPHLTLLRDLLGALCDEPPVVTVEHRFDFIIRPLVIQDFDRLQPPLAGDENAESIITSLATLFNAAGKRDGVVFRLEVRA